jgi:hypothetical protein
MKVRAALADKIVLLKNSKQSQELLTKLYDLIYTSTLRGDTSVIVDINITEEMRNDLISMGYSITASNGMNKISWENAYDSNTTYENTITQQVSVNVKGIAGSGTKTVDNSIYEASVSRVIGALETLKDSSQSTITLEEFKEKISGLFEGEDKVEIDTIIDTISGDILEGITMNKAVDTVSTLYTSNISTVKVTGIIDGEIYGVVSGKITGKLGELVTVNIQQNINGIVYGYAEGTQISGTASGTYSGLISGYIK